MANSPSVITFPNRARLEVQSYIGSEIAQMGSQGERPPRSAKLVVSVDMGSGPGGGDYRTYLISTDERKIISRP